jgi:hypothetical protein
MDRLLLVPRPVCVGAVPTCSNPTPPRRYCEMKRTKEEALVADVHSLSAGLKAYTTSFTNTAIRWAASCWDSLDLMACGGPRPCAAWQFCRKGPITPSCPLLLQHLPRVLRRPRLRGGEFAAGQ